MDSTLRDDASDMYSISNMRGRDNLSQMDRNMMNMDQRRYSNMMGSNLMGQDSMDRSMMGQDIMGDNMMHQNNMGHNMMGRNIYNIMSNRGMTADMSNMMG